MGKFPNGLRQFTFPMTRRYNFAQMTVPDHEILWKGAKAPTAAELQGVWRMDVISNANQAVGTAFLAFDNKPDGRLEARYQLMGLIEGLVLPTFWRDHFQLNDFTPFRDEVRRLDDGLMIGKWITNVPTALPLPANDLGIFHIADNPGGADTFGFYYLLHKTDKAALPTSRLLSPILDASVPRGTGMEFDETMEGWYYPGESTPSPDRSGDLTIAARDQSRGVPCSFTVKMMVDDLNDFIDGPEHESRMSGKIKFSRFEGLDSAEFRVDPKRSRFNYLRVNPATREAEMRYSIEFHAGTRVFSLEGRKYMQKDDTGPVRAAQEVLSDYTTLYTHVYEHKGNTRTELGTGLMKFRTFEDLMAVGNLAGFLGSFRITGSQDPRVKLLAQSRFYAFTGQFVQLEYDPLALPITSAAGTGGN